MDVFDITLSHEGIDIKRPGRNDQYMGWDRVSQWEIDERTGYVLLTLRGDGAVTPLVVKGWTLDDLEMVMRETTAGRRGPDPNDMEIAAPADAPGPPPRPASSRRWPPHTSRREQVLRRRPYRRWPLQRPPLLSQAEPVRPRAARRQRRSAGSVAALWKAVVTVTLLCALAAAVARPPVQSAGVISWSFLGPTA